MNWESFLSASAIGIAFVVAFSSLHSAVPLRRTLVALVGVVVTACSVAVARPFMHEADDPRPQIELPQPSTDGGYASSTACKSCHPREYSAWHDSFHRTMTQVASPQTVKGDFQEKTLEALGHKIRLKQEGDDYLVDLPATDWERRTRKVDRIWKRVVLITGSHHYQVYWTPGEFDGELRAIPFVYHLAAERWIPREGSFVAPSDGAGFWRWNDICIQCHTTHGTTRLNYQDKRMESRVSELGIACEACHGPAAEHVKVQRDLERRGQDSKDRDDKTIVQPARLSQQASSQVCASCHSVSIFRDAGWLTEGQKYRPGDDLELTKRILRPRVKPQDRVVDGRSVDDVFWPDGMIRVTGREYNAMIESACYQKGGLSCLSCHSMHNADPDDQLIFGKDSDQTCLQCHKSFESRIAKHTHHALGSPGSRCSNCHMPHTTFGLLKAVQSHLIDRPSVASSPATGRPNACNQCHLDKTLEWTSRYLSQWYDAAPVELTEEQRTVSATLIWLLRGDAGQRALAAWSMGWQPAKQASGDEWLAPFLGTVLEHDPYPAVRFVAEQSLRQLPGYKGIDCSFAPSRERTQAARQIAEKWTESSAPGEAARPNLLIGSNGKLDQKAIDGLLRSRNNRRVILAE